MAELVEVVGYADSLLSADSFQDYCPNGLQVEGRASIRRLISGVTASRAFLEAALEEGADALLVHHGYFWKGEDSRVTGMKRERLKLLLSGDISLLAYHLPLDAHPEYGNNAQLARVLDFTVEDRFEGDPQGTGLALYGRPPGPMDPHGLSAHLASRLGRMPLHIDGGGKQIRTVGWCTGAAQSFIEAVVKQGVDAFVSGEISEPTVHVARECGIHYYAAGHHATERYGVEALGTHLAEHFNIEHRFFDIDNPV